MLILARLLTLAVLHSTIPCGFSSIHPVSPYRLWPALSRKLDLDSLSVSSFNQLALTQGFAWTALVASWRNQLFFWVIHNHIKSMPTAASRVWVPSRPPKDRGCAHGALYTFTSMSNLTLYSTSYSNYPILQTIKDLLFYASNAHFLYHAKSMLRRYLTLARYTRIAPVCWDWAW